MVSRRSNRCTSRLFTWKNGATCKSWRLNEIPPCPMRTKQYHKWFNRTPTIPNINLLVIIGGQLALLKGQSQMNGWVCITNTYFVHSVALDAAINSKYVCRMPTDYKKQNGLKKLSYYFPCSNVFFLKILVQGKLPYIWLKNHHILLCCRGFSKRYYLRENPYQERKSKIVLNKTSKILSYIYVNH